MSKQTLEYTQKGDFFFPNIAVESKQEEIDKYGSLRRTFLKEHRPGKFSGMKLAGTLYPHLLEIDRTANKRLEQIMSDMLEQNPAPDKVSDQMGWVQHINSIKSAAEEIIMAELICI